MFYWILLCVVGLGMLFAEVFIPTGGILGILALGCTGFGIYQVFQESTGLGIFFVLFTVAYVAWLIFFWLRRVSHVQVLEQTDTLGTDRTIEDLLGQVGEAVTILRPTGLARFGRKKVTVVTPGNFIAKGARVRVVETSGNRVVVREAPEVDEPAAAPADDSHQSGERKE